MKWEIIDRNGALSTVTTSTNSFPVFSRSISSVDSLEPNGSAVLSDEALFGDKKCAQCSKPGSTLYCSGCIISDVGQLRIWYCGKDCQEAHWKEHKASCKTRRSLGQAVSVLTELWAAFEASTYTTQTQFKKAEGNVIHLRSGSVLDPKTFTGGSCIRAWPDEVVPKDLPDDLKRSLLFYMTCCEVLGVGLPLVKQLLKRT